MLRRAYEYQDQRQILLGKNLIYDTTHQVLMHDKQPVALTPAETKVLNILAEHKGRTVSRDDLMMLLWSTDEFVSDGTLNTTISRLRKKLFNACGDELIETKKGSGYLIP